MLALWLGDRLGIDGNAQHAMATARRGMRPSVVLIVSPSLYPLRRTGPKRSESRDGVDRQTDRQTNCIL